MKQAQVTYDADVEAVYRAALDAVGKLKYSIEGVREPQQIVGYTKRKLMNPHAQQPFSLVLNPHGAQTAVTLQVGDPEQRMIHTSIGDAMARSACVKNVFAGIAAGL